jgi:hypothetical protein
MAEPMGVVLLSYIRFRYDSSPHLLDVFLNEIYSLVGDEETIQMLTESSGNSRHRIFKIDILKT